MIFLKWIIIILATLNFGFMLFDGSRAMIKGDYVRPSSGEYAGQLGPWSKLVQVIGINPESVFMKMIFIFLGLAGITATIAFGLDLSWGKKMLIILNCCSVWYLVPGTISSVLQLIALFVFL